MKGLMNYKTLSDSVKDIDVQKRIVTGYLSAFNNKDFDNDIILRGAFAKSIQERKDQIFFLNQHNWKEPHGKFALLQEDDKGLYFESNPLPDTTYSNDAIKLYEAGIVAEHSFGYQVIQGDYDSKSDTRTIKEIKLYEGSNVTLGANPNTPFLGMKALTSKEIQDKTELIYKAVKDGTFTDETFVLLEIALKELQLQSFNMGLYEKEKSLETIEAEKSLQLKLQADEIKRFINSIKN